MGKPKKNSFNIPLPNLEPVEKFEWGNKGYSFNEIKDLKPCFAFDYVSLNQNDLCFNYNKLTVKDYYRFFEGLKKVSEKTYEELKNNKYYRFHLVNLNDKSVSINDSELIKALKQDPQKVKTGDLPNLYQFDLFEQARAAGFLYKGVFYLIWFDRFHKIYPRK